MFDHLLGGCVFGNFLEISPKLHPLTDPMVFAVESSNWDTIDPKKNYPLTRLTLLIHCDFHGSYIELEGNLKPREIMFGMKSKKEKLESKYAQLLQEAYELSHVNRQKSDQKTAEADELRKQIDAMPST